MKPEKSEFEEFEALREALWPTDDPEAGWGTELLERLAAALPGDPGVTSALGHKYSEWGRFAEALDADRRTVELLPGNPVAWYNLACSCSLAQRAEESAKALGRAIELGFDDWEEMEADSDLDWLRARPEYRRVRRLAQMARRGGFRG
ncbi:MAG: hypothetical protein IK066_07635 [Kiritimatiellae bacterium]|nr:hypothetical protein [Kiritimatiellia bacterium]